MASSYLATRLELLRKTQNPDGGWGYFPGKQSWLEPTCYAALALHGEASADRAWKLLEGWQGADGAWRPQPQIEVAHTGTALAVILATVRGQDTSRGVNWLLDLAGQESSLKNRLAARIGLIKPERNLEVKGWPWIPGSSAWVEPTAHALVALKKQEPSAEIRERIGLGEAQLLDVRCNDGGWNYGSRVALNIDLFSYPETTGLALLGLQGRSELGISIDRATRFFGETRSPLALAWLTIALRFHGAKVPEVTEQAPPPDLQIVALEALAQGNYALLSVGGRA